jgi:hypothetical protein
MGTELANYDEELAKYAKAAADSVSSSITKLSVRNGVMSIGGQPLKEGELDVVIVDFLYEHAFYQGKFNADDLKNPVCWALAREESELAPNDEVEAAQSPNCAGCPENQWPADGTRGPKGCKDTYRLGLLHVSDAVTPESVKNGNVIYYTMPVTSGKNFSYYVKGLATGLKRPPFSVVTKLRVIPDKKTQFKITFEYMANLENTMVPAILARREAVMEEIFFPYAKNPPPAPAPSGQKFNR